MKKTVFAIMVACMALVTSCSLSKKSDDKTDGGQETTQQEGGTPTGGEQTAPEAPKPDNAAAAKISEKFNQGPAINNDDYDKALAYLSLYDALMDEINQSETDAEARQAAIVKLEKEYPYASELRQILYQASKLDKIAGGLVPMNDDNRARFDELLNASGNAQ